MAENDLNREADSFADRIARIRKWYREHTRPKIIGEAPTSQIERQAYVFAQAIRSRAARRGAPHAMGRFLITIHGSPKIPKQKNMVCVLESAYKYINRSECVEDAEELTLIQDEGGRISIVKSSTLPDSFNFTFKAC